MSSYIRSSDFVIDNKRIWFFSTDVPVLCCYDLESEMMKKIIPIPYEGIGETRFFERIVRIKDEIIGIPYNADYYFVHSLVTDTSSILKLADPNSNSKLPNCYVTFWNRGLVYSFQPFTNDDETIDETYKVAVLNLESKETSQYRLSNSLDFWSKGTHYPAFRRDYSFSRDTCFVLHGEYPEIVECKAGASEVFFHKPCEEDFKFLTITEIKNGKFCLTDNKRRIWVWDCENDSFSNIDVNIRGFQDPYGDAFAYSIVVDSTVYIFPYFSNTIIEFSPDSMEVKKAFFSDEVTCFEYVHGMSSLGYENEQFSRPYLYEDNLVIWNLWNKNLYFIDLKMKRVKGIKIKAFFEEELSSKLLSRTFEKNSYVMENFYINLETFINTI